MQYRDGLSFEWENGRRLKTVTNNGTTLTMLYDSNGLRTQKGGVRYYYDSDNNLIAMVKDGNTLFFYYDENGSATSFSLGGNMYFYVKNLQGDIINIVDSSGTVLVRYDYDVFGKIVSVTDNSDPTITGVQNFALINPLRYRGYVFDDETGLYYLQSRYYDPVTGRFINADVYADTGSGSPLSTNLFSYCENNCLFKFDFTGTNAYWLQDEDAVNIFGINFGHTSILMELSKGDWWYFYWGDKDIQLLHLGKGRSLKKFNQFLHGYKVRNTRGGFLSPRNNPWGYDYYKDSNYTHTKKIIGDFRESIKYVFYVLMGNKSTKKITSQAFSYNNKDYKNPNYNVTKRNCVQVSIEVLKKGKFYWEKTGKYNSDIDALKRAMLDYAQKKGYSCPNLIFYNLDQFFLF